MKNRLRLVFALASVFLLLNAVHLAFQLESASAQVPNIVGFGTSNVLANGLSTTVKTVKASAGMLAWYNCGNTNAAPVFIQAFDVAGATTVTLGTTVPSFTLALPTSSAIHGNLALPANFFKGLKVAATTTATGSTAPGAAVDCSFGIK